MNVCIAHKGGKERRNCGPHKISLGITNRKGKIFLPARELEFCSVSVFLRIRIYILMLSYFWG